MFFTLFGYWVRGGFGLWANLPVPKRALRAHGLPPWGSSAPAHLTHPTAMQPAGGAHASSSSVDGVLGLGGGGAEEGGTTCWVLSGPRFPWLATSSPPLPPGEDAPPGKKETGSRKHRRSAD